MNRTTLVIPEAISKLLRDWTELEVESAGVLLVRHVEGVGGNLRLLANEFLPVPDEAYRVREVDQLLIVSEGYVAALSRAEMRRSTAIWLHTHPGKSARPIASSLDRRVDRQLQDLFRLRTGSDFYGSVIVSQEHGELTFTGRLTDGGNTVRIDRLMTVGSRVRLSWSYDTDAHEFSERYDRNLLAFGRRVQAVIQDLRIAVVGCGGTGSAVAEQLTRLGVQEIMLVDPDVIDKSNLSRVYGSSPNSIGQPKVAVLGQHLRHISPEVSVDELQSSILREATARKLADCDLIFGCTDDNAGRLILSRVSSYLLIPVFDLGVILTKSDDGGLGGIDGRITALYPGAACLVCRGRIDLALASAELMTPDERHRRAEEGYAPGLPEAQPAVVAFTTMVAAWAVAELLERVSGYGCEPSPNELLLRIHDREVSTNIQNPRVRHYCDPSSGKIGLGITVPFLDQVWTS